MDNSDHRDLFFTSYDSLITVHLHRHICSISFIMRFFLSTLAVLSVMFARIFCYYDVTCHDRVRTEQHNQMMRKAGESGESGEYKPADSLHEIDQRLLGRPRNQKVCCLREPAKSGTTDFSGVAKAIANSGLPH